ncbi:hypothetical protein C2R22_16020 [Salinigranum rubrum]|uniref:histidine kinase n=1 Tax=Salinigranum rubrum TaxID=755307 RepID=A0A2I8VM01_9EURY|nr:hypothetical protein C2R22_16020 [Salinigranum rubrum]
MLVGNVAAALEQVKRTGQVQARERELTRQNDRLKEFTSIVSHDLRSPLNVAEGRLALAMDECESDHLPQAAQALDRMGALIDDLLTLAREGDREREAETVDLASLARSSWRHVATADATLVTETERTVRGDESRLQQLFENLFRNSVEHGGDDITVTVGDTGTGFYVADNGPGIPADTREAVFDAGYSTVPNGTGFGLSIVKQVVDDHGWTIAVTDSADGGTRVEVTDVDGEP